MSRLEISWDPDSGLATFRGPGGFTQVEMWQPTARAIAQALAIPFFIAEPGTTVRP